MGSAACSFKLEEGFRSVWKYSHGIGDSHANRGKRLLGRAGRVTRNERQAEHPRDIVEAHEIHPRQRSLTLSLRVEDWKQVSALSGGVDRYQATHHEP
jgi:hypothetical protein